MTADLAFAGLFAAISSIVSVTPSDHRFYLRWIQRRYLVTALLTLVANLAAAVLGYLVVTWMNWPDEATHPALRGLAMASIGQAAVRVQFTHLPTVSGGLTLLGVIIKWIHSLGEVWVEDTARDHLALMSSRQLGRSAEQIMNEDFGHDSTIKARTRQGVIDDLTALVERMDTGTPDEQADAENQLRSVLVQLILKYKIRKRRFLDPLAKPTSS